MQGPEERSTTELTTSGWQKGEMIQKDVLIRALVTEMLETFTEIWEIGRGASLRR